MPQIDKETEKQVVSLLSKVNLMIFLERSNDQVRRVLELVKKLPDLEREIMDRKYLTTEADYVRHQDIYNNMGMSSVRYTKIRLTALSKIAAEFGLLATEEVIAGQS